VLNVFNLLQWCFNRLIPTQSPHSGVNVSPRMEVPTRGSYQKNERVIRARDPGIKASNLQQGGDYAISSRNGGRRERKESRRATFVDVPPESYICTSLICVAMYHLLPKLSFTPALRSP